MEYIIVQAGGKGTRMESLTKNKPKALVPVNNLPMIFHLFKKYPDKKYIIVGDYKFDVLERYLAAYASVDYKLVCASGKKGTCAGLKDALNCIPENEGFMLIWCDLVLPQDFQIPNSESNLIGISKDFPCRWKYENDQFEEERSTEQGVAGLFVFNEKTGLVDVPEEGEFVRWLQSKGYTFEELPLFRTHEYGLYSEWEKLPKMRCRPFNKLTVEGDKIYKSGIDEQGKKLAVREIAWYKHIQALGKSESIPVIYDYDPLCMEYIDGKNIYEFSDLSYGSKKEILKQLIDCLKSVHALESIPANRDSFFEAYIGKTYDRLKTVRCLVPFANDKTITINEKVCRNVFYHQDEIEKMVMEYIPKEFSLIHGDCTFSNTLLRKNNVPVMIDPRGYFGHTELYGDPAYDWVKLYYSLVSNYDQFNLKRFKLEITDKDVKLDIESNHWEDLEEDFFNFLAGEVSKKQMRLLLAITWLSLTTYAWEDYDSICGAFYNGLYYLEDVLK